MYVRWLWGVEGSTRDENCHTRWEWSREVRIATQGGNGYVRWELPREVGMVTRGENCHARWEWSREVIIAMWGGNGHARWELPHEVGMVTQDENCHVGGNGHARWELPRELGMVMRDTSHLVKFFTPWYSWCIVIYRHLALLDILDSKVQINFHWSTNKDWVICSHRRHLDGPVTDPNFWSLMNHHDGRISLQNYLLSSQNRVVHSKIVLVILWTPNYYWTEKILIDNNYKTIHGRGRIAYSSGKEWILWQVFLLYTVVYWGHLSLNDCCIEFYWREITDYSPVEQSCSSKSMCQLYECLHIKVLIDDNGPSFIRRRLFTTSQVTSSRKEGFIIIPFWECFLCSLCIN